MGRFFLKHTAYLLNKSFHNIMYPHKNCCRYAVMYVEKYVSEVQTGISN